MEKINIFDNEIYKVNYQFDWDALKDFCIKYDNDFKSGLISDEDFRPHKSKEFKDYYNYIEPLYLNVIKEKWGLPKSYEYYVVDSWLRSTTYGEYVAEHNHGKVVAVVCAYLRIPEDSEMLEVRNPSFDLYNFVPFEDNNWGWKKLSLKDNDVVIMPGWFYHRTQENKSKDIRFMIATNIGIRVNKKVI
jgi:hypothetical protein